MKQTLSKIKEVECPEWSEAESKGKYYVYILFCSDQSFYCGTTYDLRNRLKEHNSGEAAVWTRKRLPVKLVYYEVHSSLINARRRERQIKGWTVNKKSNLITGVWEKQ